LKLYANDSLGNWGVNDSIGFTVDTNNILIAVENKSGNTVYYLNASLALTLLA
jgi:hypothetical protein